MHILEIKKRFRHLDDLVDEIYQRVKEQGYLFRTVGIKLVRTNFSVETRVTTFEEFRNDSESISSAIGQLLDKFDLSENRPCQKNRLIGYPFS